MSFFRNVTASFNVANQSAFGDLITQNLTPVIQMGFEYGINNQIGVSTVANGGSVDSSGSRARLQTSTANNGSAILNSIKSVRYRQGQGTDARFTFAFSTGVVNSVQRVGVSSGTDGYFFGYNGTSFGILHRNNSSDTWIAQASWNGLDKLNGSGISGVTLDPTKGNVYRVVYPFLGYGAVHFFVLLPSGSWTLVHTIQYPNSSANVQLLNPNLQFHAEVTNSGNTSNLIGYVGSVGIFRCGETRYLGPAYGVSNRKQNITTQTNILTIRNATTYNGLSNRGLIRVKSIAIAWDGGNDTCLLNAIKNTTLGGTPSFTPISGSTADNGVTIANGNSVASIDTAGTTITGGIIQYNMACARNTGFVLDVTPLELFVEPNSTLTLAVTGDSSGNARVAINWIEDI